MHGSNFGPEAQAVSVTAWSTPLANDSLVFPGVNCTVVVDHSVIQCLTSPSVGSKLTWSVVVEGLVNAVPTTSVAPPVVSNASFVGLARDAAATTGGSQLIVFGTNFGVLVDVVSVTLKTAFVGGDASTTTTVAATGCQLLSPDTVLVCVMPPGTGRISAIIVTVLGQAGTLAEPGRRSLLLGLQLHSRRRVIAAVATSLCCC